MNFFPVRYKLCENQLRIIHFWIIRVVFVQRKDQFRIPVIPDISLGFLNISLGFHLCYSHISKHLDARLLAV